MGKAQILSQITQLLFPPFCCHCRQAMERCHPLCSSCLQFLDIVPITYHTDIVTFEAEGPALSLLYALKSGKAPSLASGLAGYMCMQYLQSSLPRPDLIVPIPQAFYRFLQVGYNPSVLLAQAMGKILGSPVVSLLKRKHQHLRQMKIDKERRYRLSVENFQWKKRIPIATKTVLLVDDIRGTGATLRCCERRLSEGFPLRVIKMAALQEKICE